MNTIHIAVLDCDFTVPEIAKKYGPRYSDLFTSLLQAAGTRKPPSNTKTVGYSAWDVQAGNFPDPTTIDALIIGGGIDAAYDKTEWVLSLIAYVQKVYHYHPHIRLFGACLGHQVIAHALLAGHGIYAEPNPAGRQFGIRSVALNPEFSREFQCIPETMLTMRIQVVHGDHVFIPANKIPPGWVLVGSTSCCAVHGLYQPDRVLTLQGHFEFSEEISTVTIKYFFTPEAGFTEEYVSAGLELVKGQDDAEIAASMILDFLTGEAGTRSIEPAATDDVKIVATNAISETESDIKVLAVVA